MDHRLARRILSLDAISEGARKSAKQATTIADRQAAVEAELWAERQLTGIVMSEVRPYSDRD